MVGLYSQNTYGCDFLSNEHNRRFAMGAIVTMPKAEGRFVSTVERTVRSVGNALQPYVLVLMSHIFV